MRLLVGVLACLSVGGISSAVADPPAPPASTATPATPATPTTPATATSPASTSAPAAPAQDAKAAASAADSAKTPGVLIESTPDLSTLEKHFLAEGYKMEMRNGEKVFCRKEQVMGSRLQNQKSCGSALQLSETERQAQSSLNRSMMQQNNPSGH
jgi:hypothetical protein